MNKIKQLLNPVGQVGVWIFAAVIYLGGGKVNVAIRNALWLVLVISALSIMLQIKEKIELSRHITRNYYQLRHLLYLISKDDDITQYVTNETYRESLKQEIRGGKWTDEAKFKDADKYKFGREWPI